MSDLLELLLNVALEAVGAGLEEWASWRFFVPLLSSIAIACLMGWLMPEPGIARTMVIVVGMVAGVVWEIMGAQSAGRSAGQDRKARERRRDS